MASSTIPISIILTGDSTWHIWIELIRTSAQEVDIWEYINPNSKDTKLPALIQPTEPTFQDAHPVLEGQPPPTLSSLTPAELSYYQALRIEYREDLRLYKEKKRSISRMCSLIQASIQKDLITHTLNCESARDMLISLKAQYCANQAVRERQLLAEYHQYKVLSATESIDKWISNWEVAYNKCKEVGASEVDGAKPYFDFIHAVQDRVPGFHSAWYFRLLRDPTAENLNIHTMIQELKDYLRGLKPAPKGRHSAFSAAYQGESDADTTANSNSKKQPPGCACGEPHWFRQCEYLNPAVRPTGWKADSRIEKRIKDKLKSDKRLKAAYERFKARQDLQQQSNQSQEPKEQLSTALMAAASFSASGHQWELYNSFILDSGATTHICHTRSRFANFRPAKDQLITAALPLPIEGYGDVDITIQRDGLPIRVTLKNTAYIPDCTTNMMACRKAFEAGIKWDQEGNRLTQKGHTWCQLQLVNDLSVVEFNQPTAQQVAYLSGKYHKGQYVKSTEPTPAQEVSIQTLHRRFAHPGTAATRHIAEATQGIRLATPEISESTGNDPNTPECEVCHLAKGKKIIKRAPVPLPQAPYEVVSLDLLEFQQVNKDAGYGKYALHLYCRYTGMNHIYILPTKREQLILSTIQDFVAYTDRRQLPIRVIQTDGEAAIGSTSEHWLSSKGIALNRSPPYTQDQNGAAERSGGVIITMARALHIDSQLPGYMWPEVATATGYLLNRTPRQRFNWKTPFEVLQSYQNRVQDPNSTTDPRPRCGHIRVFGCRAYPLIQNQPKLDKLEPRCAIGYLVGWDSTNIFRIWIPSLQKVIRTRDVTFDESVKYDPRAVETPLPKPIIEVLDLISITDIGEIDEIDESETIQPAVNLLPQPTSGAQSQPKSTDTGAGTVSEAQGLITPETTPGPENHPETEPGAAGTDLTSQNPNTATDTQLIEPIATVGQNPGGRALARQPASGTDLASRELNQQPSQPTARTYDTSQGVDSANILTERRARKPRKQAYLTALESVTELTGYHTAFMAGAEFKRYHRSQLPEPPANWGKLKSHLFGTQFATAALKEYTELAARRTWRLVTQADIDGTIKALPLKWVFTYKFDTDGYLTQFKARICVRGDLQPFSDQDNYAATLAAKVFRALMAITARFGLEAVQLDAISAFTNSSLDEQVYTYLPDGFKQTGKLLLLLRALYGLRRSPLMWLREFSSTLTRLGLKPIPESQCLFTNGRITVFFYVDDVVILYHKKHQTEFDQFKQSLLQAYDFKDLGELKWFLGIRVIRDRPNYRLWLCQDSYIEKITKSFNLVETATYKTPLSTAELTANTGQPATAQEVHAYQRRIGSTTYATSITRPDAARASNKLAEYLLNPSPAHLKAANRLIKYLYDTRYLAIKYSSQGARLSPFLPENPEMESPTEPEFRCSTDAAFGDNADTRKSTEGYLFKLFGGPIDWKSTRQKLVTKSSTEAELVALSHASTEIYWWRRFFTQIQLQLDDYEVECDNQQTIRLLTTPAIKLATKLKHIDIHHHWLRQEVQENRLQLKWIPTALMPADGFTKALPIQKHNTFIKQLGLVDIQHLIKDIVAN